MKILPIRPHVRAIVRDINRQVAHDADAVFPRIFAQLTPLREERELKEFLSSDGRGQLRLPAG